MPVLTRMILDLIEGHVPTFHFKYRQADNSPKNKNKRAVIVSVQNCYNDAYGSAVANDKE